jgi:F-type H+-transporting ATPase subunit a
VKGSDCVGDTKYLFDITLLGHTYGFSTSIVIQWVIILLLAAVSVFLTRRLERIPDKRQSVAEILIESLQGFVKSTMGDQYLAFIPYVGTLIAFLLLMNLTGLVGFEPPTMDYSVALGMALITFLVIQVYAIKKLGVGHYFLGYTKPMFFLLPMNLMERFLLPVSLSLRLFGNMTAASIIMNIIYSSLSGLSWFAQIGIPVPLHIYFDVFDGVVQMIVFTMLTMINIKVIVEH